MNIGLLKNKPKIYKKNHQSLFFTLKQIFSIKLKLSKIKGKAEKREKSMKGKCVAGYNSKL